MKKILLSLVLLSPTAAFTQPYAIDWVKSSGGGGKSSGGIFQVSGTIGQHDAADTITGGNYSVTGGFWSLVSIIQSAGAPMLTITHFGNTVKVSWPYPSSGWTLEQTPDLKSAGWSTSGGVSNDGTNNSITLISPTGNKFFRLSHP
jgi:hypothetical protein